MPEQFSPEWEYWTPGEEWAEAFGESCASEFDVWTENRTFTRDQTKTLGFRFGSGNPDNAYLRERFRFDPLPRRNESSRTTMFLPPRKERKAKRNLERYRAGRIYLPCNACGETFDTTNPARLFCSRRCWGESARVFRPCGFCGDEFWGRKSYCSKECRLSSRSAGDPSTCRYCGDLFVSRSRKYCTQFCKQADTTDVPAVATCRGCDCEYAPVRVSQRYCSKDCRPRWVFRPLDPKPCVRCGVQFTPKRPHRMRCSRTCNPGRAKILPRERDCAVCGAKFPPLCSSHLICSRRCAATLGARKGPSVESLDKFATLRDSGLPNMDIARNLGVSESTVKRWRGSTGAAKRGRGPKPPDADRLDEFAEALRSGATIEELASMFGIGRTTVQSWRKLTGIPPRGRGEHWAKKKRGGQ